MLCLDSKECFLRVVLVNSHISTMTGTPLPELPNCTRIVIENPVGIYRQPTRLQVRVRRPERLNSDVQPSIKTHEFAPGSAKSELAVAPAAEPSRISENLV
jgi:hypothetical protein